MKKKNRISRKYLTPPMPEEKIVSPPLIERGTEKLRYPVDKKKTAFYFILSVVIIIVLIPIMVFIHEMGHAIAILLLGGEVTDFHFSYTGGYVSFTGIESSRDLFLVHLSGVLANTIVGAYLLFHVWRYKGHPFQEALTLLWGLILFLTDFMAYTISDIFYEHEGDFDKIYDIYPWSIPVFVLIDLVLVCTILVLLTRHEFWKGIQLPRKTGRSSRE